MAAFVMPIQHYMEVLARETRQDKKNTQSNWKERELERKKIIFIPIKSFKTHKTLLAVIN